MVDKVCVRDQHLLNDFLALDGNHEESTLQDEEGFEEIIVRVNLTELGKLALKRDILSGHGSSEISHMLSEEASIELNHVRIAVVNWEVVPCRRQSLEVVLIQSIWLPALLHKEHLEQKILMGE